MHEIFPSIERDKKRKNWFPPNRFLDISERHHALFRPSDDISLGSTFKKGLLEVGVTSPSQEEHTEIERFRYRAAAKSAFRLSRRAKGGRLPGPP
jgi:hypothetical protein